MLLSPQSMAVCMFSVEVWLQNSGALGALPSPKNQHRLNHPNRVPYRSDHPQCGSIGAHPLRRKGIHNLSVRSVKRRLFIPIGIINDRRARTAGLGGVKYSPCAFAPTGAI